MESTITLPLNTCDRRLKSVLLIRGSLLAL